MKKQEKWAAERQRWKEKHDEEVESIRAAREQESAVKATSQGEIRELQRRLEREHKDAAEKLEGLRVKLEREHEVHFARREEEHQRVLEAEHLHVGAEAAVKVAAALKGKAEAEKREKAARDDERTAKLRCEEAVRDCESRSAEAKGAGVAGYGRGVG